MDDFAIIFLKVFGLRSSGCSPCLSRQFRGGSPPFRKNLNNWIFYVWKLVVGLFLDLHLLDDDFDDYLAELHHIFSGNFDID